VRFNWMDRERPRANSSFNGRSASRPNLKVVQDHDSSGFQRIIEVVQTQFVRFVPIYIQVEQRDAANWCPRQGFMEPASDNMNPVERGPGVPEELPHVLFIANKITLKHPRRRPVQLGRRGQTLEGIKQPQVAPDPRIPQRTPQDRRPPPRYTPHSTMSPGIPSRSISRTRRSSWKNLDASGNESGSTFLTVLHKPTQFRIARGVAALRSSRERKPSLITR